MTELIAPIQIPWVSDGDLGGKYFDVCADLSDLFQWVPFMDHDVEILTRDWHRRLTKAIKAHPDAGLFACRVNLQHRCQTSQSLKIHDDLNAKGRMAVAEVRARQFKDNVTRIGASPPELISGCWFCVNVQRFLQVGHPTGFYGADNWIHRTLHNAGYPAYIMEGMVVWHRYTHLERREERSDLKRVVVPPLTRR